MRKTRRYHPHKTFVSECRPGGHCGVHAGAAGIGDPYYPQDGNGGYDVGHYDLAVGYEPAVGVLTGRATITATATQNLSAFDLDLASLTVSALTVDGSTAA